MASILRSVEYNADVQELPCTSRISFCKEKPMAGNKENPVIDGCKECTKCREVLSLDLFNKAKQNPSGRRAACKSCQYQADKNRIARRRDGDRRDGRARYMFDENGMKPCSVCGELKTADGFTPAPLMASGYERRCKACNVNRNNARKRSDIRFAMSVLLANSKRSSSSGRSSRRATFEYTVTVDDLCEKWKSQNGLCAISGEPMTTLYGEGRVPTNVSLDRIDNTAGYTKDNVRLVCFQSNCMRNELDDDELIKWCRAVVAHHST